MLPCVRAWLVSLGGHLRTHGHTAESYRAAMGLCRTRPLVAEALSISIATRQARAYRRSPAVRARLATGQELSRTGRLAGLARIGRARSVSPELARIRRAALDAGRATRATRRDQALARRLAELGADNLVDYLRDEYAAGASLRRLTGMTGLGWARLRREIDASSLLLVEVSVADYTLPDLPYDYGALEPYVSGQIMELHHGKHHATYVKGANTAIEQMAEARAAHQLGTVNLLAKNLAFNLGGHVNHSVFWPNMSPDGGDKPDGELAAAIDEHFGSFDAFRAQFTANALGVQGSGWSVLAWDTLGQRMVLQQVYDHQGNLAPATVPLLLLDMWEHAFYLQYRNVKADFVDAWWNVANWADVTRRFEHARAITLP